MQQFGLMPDLVFGLRFPDGFGACLRRQAAGKTHWKPMSKLDDEHALKG